MMLITACFFLPIAAIIRFSSESMLVVLYRIVMAISRWWDLNICDDCYILFLTKQQETSGMDKQ